MGDSKSIMRTQRRKKIDAIEKFGGKCSICGYDKCINALEFHHIDEKTKKHSPSYIIMRKSWDVVREELEKCILVCSNCHREIHYKILDLNLDKFIKPWLKKKCEFCDTEFETKREEQKYCTTTCYQYNQRKVERPSKEELKELIDNKISWTQIGRMFGVSDNGVRKWAKKYEII